MKNKKQQRYEKQKYDSTIAFSIALHKGIKTKFAGMLQRCENKNCDNYKYYGDKGITVCSYWRDNPDNFYLWCLINKYKPGKEIHRLNPHKGYDPNNCVLLTPAEHVKYHKDINRYKECCRGLQKDFTGNISRKRKAKNTASKGTNCLIQPGLTETYPITPTNEKQALNKGKISQQTKTKYTTITIVSLITEKKDLPAKENKKYSYKKRKAIQSLKDLSSEQIQEILKEVL